MPQEFKFVVYHLIAKNGKPYNDYYIVFYYSDGRKEEIHIPRVPEGFEIDKHYSIADLYGYKVTYDRVEDTNEIQR